MYLTLFDVPIKLMTNTLSEKPYINVVSKTLNNVDVCLFKGVASALFGEISIMLGHCRHFHRIE